MNAPLRYDTAPITAAEFETVQQDFLLLASQAGMPAEVPRLHLQLRERAELIGYASALCYGAWAYLTDLWIRADRRRKGHGTALLAQFERQLQAGGVQALHLWTDGEEAAAFYERCGYSRHITMRGYGTENAAHIGLHRYL